MHEEYYMGLIENNVIYSLDLTMRKDFKTSVMPS